jgi:hypothetical protein
MNPVAREGMEIYFHEGHGLTVYFYFLAILAPVEFLALYLPSLDAQMWSGSGNLFKVSASTTLLLMIYFALRVANQEYAPWRFQSLRTWVRERGQPAAAVANGQIVFLALHVGCSLLLSIPLLAWAAAIARAPLWGLGATLALLLFYTFCYGIWGLVALALWERRPESRQVMIRCFLFVLGVGTLLVYLPLNPVAYLLAVLGRHDLAPLRIAGLKLPAGVVHFGFHLLLGCGGVLAHRGALYRSMKP